MPNLARVFLMGYVSRDPQMRQAQSGKNVCNFSVAVNRKWRDPSGAEHKEVTFVDCQAWDRQAEFVNRNFRKGSPIFIEGRLRQDRWQTDAGEMRSKIIVVVDYAQTLAGSPPEAINNNLS